MTRTGSRRLIPPAQPVAASLKASLVEHQLRAEVANAQEQLRGIKRVNKHLGRELRLAEDRAAPYLPPYRALQLADAIDRVIPVIRKAEIGP